MDGDIKNAKQLTKRILELMRKKERTNAAVYLPPTNLEALTFEQAKDCVDKWGDLAPNWIVDRVLLGKDIEHDCSMSCPDNCTGNDWENYLGTIHTPYDREVWLDSFRSKAK
tara:strand:- start:35 stop:370 length:336 start_codon:yes stop_codon:yes gene_type:complete